MIKISGSLAAQCSSAAGLRLSAGRHTVNLSELVCYKLLPAGTRTVESVAVKSYSIKLIVKLLFKGR